jgi:aminoglycoside phosphotransferase (APT) family kinase protein
MHPHDPGLDDCLQAHGLAAAGEVAQWRPLAGGVSSEIWRVDLPGRSLCVKRALPRLKVGVDWDAPISRNAYEWAWLCFAAEHQPQAVPRPLAHDEVAGLFVMSFLSPEMHPVWKQQLLQGVVEPGVAIQVSTVLARLHSASAHRADLAQAFDTLTNFHALRLEPYLLATAGRHPDIAEPLQALALRTGSTRLALVHGDVSPKNILVGPHGPILLDAECAWYGDPAFDVAFCLNHLLLKCLAQPARADSLLGAFAAFVTAYFDTASFESRDTLEARASALLPALLLARVDGQSPVEYLVGRPPLQALVRRVARPLIADPPVRLAAVAESWRLAIRCVSEATSPSLADPPRPL